MRSLPLLLLVLLFTNPSSCNSEEHDLSDYKPFTDESLYDVLGVSPDATAKELKRGYRKATLAHHPDKFQDSLGKAQAQVRFIFVVNAFEILSNEEKRSLYDEMLARGIMHFDMDEWERAFPAARNFRDFDSAYAAYDFYQAHGGFTEEGATVSLWLAGVSIVFGMIIPTAYVVYNRKEKVSTKEAVRSSLKAKQESQQRDRELQQALQQKQQETLERGKKLAQAALEESEAALERQEKIIKAAKRARLREAESRPAVDSQTWDQRAARPERKGPWDLREESALAQAIAKIPGGARDRWQQIAEEVNMVFPDLPPRHWKQIAKKAKSLNPLKMGKLARTVNKDDAYARYKSDMAKHKEQPAAAPNGVNDEEQPAKKKKKKKKSAGKWTVEQQQQLESAMKQVPRSSDAQARWRQIAELVDGKTASQCIARVKEIRKQLAQQESKP